MRFAIDADPRNGLRVIPSIPNISRCWLEGRNGIGKTVAVQLLELVSGRQPYAARPDEWASLRESLGPATLNISGFPVGADIQSIRVELAPDQWPTEPVPLGAELGGILIDGEIRDIQDLRSYVDVVRIGGDETVLSQIRSRVRDDQAVVARCAAVLESVADDVEALLGPLITELDGLSEGAFPATDNALRIARGRLAQSQSTLADASQRKADLEEFIRLGELQDEHARRGPEVRRLLGEAKAEVEDLTRRRTEAAERLRQLVPSTAALQRLQDEFDRLERLRRGRQDRAARTCAAAQRIALAAGVGCDAAEAAMEALRAERESLRRDRAALASLPDILELVDSTRAPLADVEGSSLDSEVIAVVAGEARVTTSALRLGLDARSEELRRNIAYAELAHIDSRIRDLESRLFEVRNVVSHVHDAERKAELLAEVENEIETVGGKLRDKTGQDYSAASELFDELDAQLARAVRRQAELSTYLDLLGRSGGTDSVAKKLVDLEERLGVALKEAPEALGEAGLRLTTLGEQALQSQSELQQAENARRALDAQFVRALQLVARSEECRWLRDSLQPDQIPTTRVDRRNAARRLTRLASALQRVQSKFEMSLDHVAAIEGSLRGVQQSIATHRAPPDNPLNESLIQRHEMQMAQYLSNRAIREAIFEGGAFERFSLVDGFVAWRTVEGEPRRRPIGAFSSGESAFAYMLAGILSSHESSSARYRMFVLDEFGAFVEEGRRDRLWHFLDERVLKAGMASQVVVMLPLQTRSLSGQEEDQLEKHGYFAVEAPL